jgi:subtilisin-like proprotein convertase family protein
MERRTKLSGHRYFWLFGFIFGMLNGLSGQLCLGAGQAFGETFYATAEDGGVSGGTSPIEIQSSGDEFGRTDNLTVLDYTTYNYLIYCDAPTGAVITSGANGFRVRVDHDWVSDLKITIISPEGTRRVLWDRDGGETDQGGDDDAEDDTDVWFSRVNVSTWNGETARGNWTLEVSDNASGDTGYIDYFYMTLYYEISNTPPTLNLTGPSSDITVSQGDMAAIAWTDSDPDDNAYIALARDSDCSEGGHTWITVGLREDPDGSGDQYLWDTTGVPTGTYRIWGTIYDTVNPVVYDCAPGSVTIDVAAPVDIRIEPTSLTFNRSASAVQQGNMIDSDISASDIEVRVMPGGLEVKSFFEPGDLVFDDHDNYTSVLLAGGLLPEDTPGSPWLPAKYISVLIPSGARVESVKVSSDEILVREGIEVYPVQPPVPLSARHSSFTDKDPDAYAMSTKIPIAIAEVTGHHIMRGYTYVSVRLNPVRYVPADKELYLVTRLTVMLNFSAPQVTATASPANNEIFQAMLEQIVVNPEMLDTTEGFGPIIHEEVISPTQVIDYLIITSSSLETSFQALANHRAGYNGLTTQVVTVESIYQNVDYSGSDSQEEIRNCIEDYVDNRGTAYVVLGGDDTIVPDRDCYVTVQSSEDLKIEDQMPTDLYYAGLDSTWDEDGDGTYGEADTTAGDEGDLAPDVLVGRIPVRSASQASAYINKLVDFENSPPAPSFREKLLICGAELWHNYTGSDRPSDSLSDGHLAFGAHSPVSDAEMWSRRLYRDGIQAFWTVGMLGYFFDTLTSWDSSTAGDYGQTSTNMSARFDEGWYQVFFGTHGLGGSWSLESGGFTASDAASLTGSTAVIYTTACLTGHFDGSPEPSLSEAFLRNEQGGAVAYFGCSRLAWGIKDPPPASNTSTGGASLAYAYEYYEQLLDSGTEVLCETFSQHKAALAGSCTSNNSYRWIQFGLNYQGDPAIGAPSSDDTFTIYNDGGGTLNVTDITKQNSSVWLSFSPVPPFNIDGGNSQTVTVSVNATGLSPSTYSDKLLVYSNDSDESPYPDGVHVDLTVVYSGPRWYVDGDATGDNNGSSWANALRHFQDALAAASSGDEIRVAEGVYRPDEGFSVTPGDREATFQLINGVAIKGGYAGFGQPDPNGRDIETYVTILSGDLDGNDEDVKDPCDLVNEPTRAENSYHVVTGSGTDASAVLDGCTITGGNANGSAWVHMFGGGMSNEIRGSPSVVNCRFYGNSAAKAGGGIASGEHSSPALTNCIFRRNAGEYGGAVHNDLGAKAALTNCIFVNNWAEIDGGGIYNWHSDNPTLRNCTFVGNLAGQGGGVSGYESSLTVGNCIFWGNMAGNGEQMALDSNSSATISYSDVAGGEPGIYLTGGSSIDWGEGNIDDDPCFVDYGYWDANGTPSDAGDDFWVDGDYHLWSGSPCIDGADNTVVPPDTADLDGDGNTTESTPWDLDGLGRFVDDPWTTDTGSGTPPIVDMGAYEYQPGPVIFGAEIDTGWDYGDANVADDLRYEFYFGIETDAAVNLIEVNTPVGYTFEIPNDVNTQSGNVQTWHYVEKGVHCWEYEAKFNDVNELDDYGYGNYVITVHYAGGGQGQTTVLFGDPCTGDPIGQPTQEPNLTFPAHNGWATSPVTFMWEDCNDENATSVWLGLEKEDESEQTEMVLPVDANRSEPCALSSGTWEATLSFDNWHDFNNVDGIAVQAGKYSESECTFEVIPAISYIEISGPEEVAEGFCADYNCIAYYSDDSNEDVSCDVNWAVDSDYASIGGCGQLRTEEVTSDQLCQVTAAYGGMTTAYDITIKNQKLVISSPRGGNTYLRGQKYYIRWKKKKIPGKWVKIELYDGCEAVRVIANKTRNDGKAGWRISRAREPGSDYKIVITSRKNGRKFVSKGRSRIKIPVINVIRPDGDESWLRGTRHYIRWKDKKIFGKKVKIELYKGGQLDSVITSSTDNDGRMRWRIPAEQEPGSDYKIKISLLKDPGIYGFSDDYFTITGP